ncbi:hypothetical protein P3T37_003719 [Kitasatospora sp. MAA4]|uniref:DUF1272 domain-containing protein n=1 Tax=Kitasatospora sp. MAA4 TaxID=3035093 RepID=UPI002475C94A|nr:DUF1272 domain-containing protein [Kitasatospora sp. MAA4]MDH6134316.1 hypothetical protein [Kitasatospora sp. MAA4]
MALEMRPVCERCQAKTGWSDDARICSYECTFCPECADSMASTCPNCGGGLVVRPHRAETV